MASSALGAGADVAILPFDRRDVDVSLSEALGDSFQVAFAKASRLNVVSPGDIAATLGFERQREALGCDDGSCLVELGGALGVQYLVTGRVARVGSAYLVLVKLVDVKKGGVVAASDQETVKVGDEGQLLAAVQRLAARFGRAVGVQLGRVGDWPTSDAAAEPPPPVAPPPAVEPVVEPETRKRPRDDDEDADEEPAKRPRRSGGGGSGGRTFPVASLVANIVAAVACGASALGLCATGVLAGVVLVGTQYVDLTFLASLVGIPCCLTCGVSLLSLAIGVPTTAVLAFRGSGKEEIDEEDDAPVRKRRKPRHADEDDE